MGRLYWKFFFFIWLAQLATGLGVTSYFYWVHQQRDAQHHEHPHDKPAALAQEGQPAPLPPHPPHTHRRPRFIPIEPLIGGFIASLIFAAVLARYFSRPIRTLRDAFRTTATGNLRVRIADGMGRRRDELTDLGRDFDQMANQLEKLLDAQRRLLHDVSHELRSPLARLQAAIGLARQKPETMEATLQRVETESIRMNKLIDELLTLSRLEAGAFHHPVEAFRLDELLADIVSDSQIEADAKAVNVNVDAVPPCLIEGSTELTHRALENIVRNAIKFSPEHEGVRIASRFMADKDQVEIVISNHGPAMNAADLDAIFEPFYRGSHAQQANGHGLGLAIARRIIESMRGDIHAQISNDDEFCVVIHLPVLKRS